MSQVLDQPPASTVDSAASADTDSPQDSAAQAADTSAERVNVDAASGEDAIAKLDSEYKKNLLSPDESEAPEPEQPTEPEKVEAKPDETVEAADEVVEPDDLVERTEPRTLEDLKKQFPRVATTALEEIAKVEAAQFELQKEVDSVGGTVGLEIAKAVMPALLSANPTAEEVDGVFQTVTETNPALMQAMSWNILTHSLKEEKLDPATGKQIRDVTGEALVKQYIDPELSLDDVFKFVEYKKAGLLDFEALDTELENYSGRSKRELELEARLKAIEDGKTQDQAAEKTKAEARVAQHVDKTEKYVVQGAMSQIVPIAEQYGWTATKEELNSSDPAVKANAEFKVAFGEFLTPWLDSFVKSHVKYAGVESLGREERAFNLDGNPTVLLKRNGGELINAAVAAFKQKVRIMNTQFAKAAGTSRNVQLKEKTTRSGAVDPSKIPEVKKAPENGDRSTDPIAALDEQYRRSVREARASL